MRSEGIRSGGEFFSRVRAITPLFLFLFVIHFPVPGSCQEPIQISNFKVLDWFKAVKLTWVVTAPEGSDGTFEIYRSEKEEGPYVIVKEIQLDDKEFFDVIAKNYVLVDKELKVGGKYYYKLSLRGTDEEFGPLKGMASGAPPGT
jgi:hypothetical protein